MLLIKKTDKMIWLSQIHFLPTVMDREKSHQLNYKYFFNEHSRNRLDHIGS